MRIIYVYNSKCAPTSLNKVLSKGGLKTSLDIVLVPSKQTLAQSQQ